MTTMCNEWRNDFLVYNTRNKTVQIWEGTDKLKFFWCNREVPIDRTAMEQFRSKFFDRYSWKYDHSRLIPRDTKNPSKLRDATYAETMKSPNTYQHAYDKWEVQRGAAINVMHSRSLPPSSITNAATNRQQSTAQKKRSREEKEQEEQEKKAAEYRIKNVKRSEAMKVALRTKADSATSKVAQKLASSMDEKKALQHSFNRIAVNSVPAVSATAVSATVPGVTMLPQRMRPTALAQTKDAACTLFNSAEAALRLKQAERDYRWQAEKHRFERQRALQQMQIDMERYQREKEAEDAALRAEAIADRRVQKLVNKAERDLTMKRARDDTQLALQEQQLRSSLQYDDQRNMMNRNSYTSAREREEDRAFQQELQRAELNHRLEERSKANDSRLKRDHIRDQQNTIRILQAPQYSTLDVNNPPSHRDSLHSASHGEGFVQDRQSYFSGQALSYPHSVQHSSSGYIPHMIESYQYGAHPAVLHTHTSPTPIPGVIPSQYQDHSLYTEQRIPQKALLAQHMRMNLRPAQVQHSQEAQNYVTQPQDLMQSRAPHQYEATLRQPHTDTPYALNMLRTQNMNYAEENEEDAIDVDAAAVERSKSFMMGISAPSENDDDDHETYSMNT